MQGSVITSKFREAYKSLSDASCSIERLDREMFAFSANEIAHLKMSLSILEFQIAELDEKLRDTYQLKIGDRLEQSPEFTVIKGSRSNED